MNCYKMEYERQHPKKGASQTALKVLSVIIAIAIVVIVARLDARADIAPAIIYQDDITGKTAEVGIAPGVNIYVPGTNCDEDATQSAAEQTNKASKQANKQANKTSEQVNKISNNSSEQVNNASNNLSTGQQSHEYSSITISDSEMEELKRIVAAEAQTQSMEGREAVVEVIFNRVLSPDYPNTVHGVLSQRGQFATWKMRNASWVVPDAATAAIEYVMSNGRTVLPDTSYLYFSRGKSSFGKDWIKIEDHWFGRGR